MDKMQTELTQNQIEALFCAASEQNITTKDLISDILPVLKEYFIADITAEGEMLCMEFLNGQKFKLITEEIK